MPNKGFEWRMNPNANLGLRTKVRCALLLRQDDCRSCLSSWQTRMHRSSCNVYICTSSLIKHVKDSKFINCIVTLLVRTMQSWLRELSSTCKRKLGEQKYCAQN